MTTYAKQRRPRLIGDKHERFTKRLVRYGEHHMIEIYDTKTEAVEEFWDSFDGGCEAARWEMAVEARGQ